MRYILYVCALLLLYSCKKDPPVPKRQLKLEAILKNLEVPWGMGYLPNGDFIFCQRQGKIGLLKHGKKEFTTIMFRPVLPNTEGGLLGLAIDPDFNNSHCIFIYETTDSNRVVRLKYENETLTDDKIILHGIPSAGNHDGGALRFGPDGFLYVGTGDALNPPSAQNLNSYGGKILRIDKDGNAAPGNPFNSRIWSYGHRNVQGFDWDNKGLMIATEHGPSGEFGWCCHDEINLIQPGKNYGWPLALGGTESDSLTLPIYNTGMDTWAPSGCWFIRGSAWGNWENNFIIGALRGQRLIRVTLSEDGTSLLSINDTLYKQFQRIRNVIQAPDGSIIFTTSNVGTNSPPPLAGDDKIFRLYYELSY